MIIGVCSLSGSPGVTTLAVSLAACWPVTPLTVPVVVEADTSGGDMAVWHRCRGERGLESMAAASRRPSPEPAEGDNPLLAHAEEAAAGVPVVTAQPAAHQCTAAVHHLAHHPSLLRSGPVTVLDVGRISPRSPGAYLLRHADAVVVTVREDAAHLARLAACASNFAKLTEIGVRVGTAVVAGTRRFSDHEIAEQTRMPLWARIPRDPLAAAFVRGEALPAGKGWWARARGWVRERRDVAPVEWLPLMRTTRDLAERVEALGQRTPAATPAPSEPVPAESAPSTDASAEARPAAVALPAQRVPAAAGACEQGRVA